MRLTELLQGIDDVTVPAGAERLDITSVTADSRQVVPGALFAAIAGTSDDGASYIAEAIAAGAAAVLGDAGTMAGVPVLSAGVPRRALALIAARLNQPQPQFIAAVTGTNGKTSVVQFCRQLWQHAGIEAAAIGTLGVTAPGYAAEPGLTTPDAPALHALLARLKRDGIDHVALEASSHGLDQYRIDGLRLTAAAFTNLSRDHLDYHATLDAYFAAKARLFAALLPAGATAVLNAEDERYAALSALCAGRGLATVTYGSAAAGAVDIELIAATPTAYGQTLDLRVFGRAEQIALPLAGRFQALNALAALGLATCCGVAMDAALAGLATLTGVPGRLQAVAPGIYVDYAHTPAALETVLTALRPHASARLMVLFGCGGNRDSGKRPQMGTIAGQLADRVFVTDDNPRDEDPATIRAAILHGCKARAVEEIGDRALAIEVAIAEHQPGDVLLIAGKGHEQGQIIGAETRPFDDAAVAQAVLARLRAVPA